MTVEAGLPAGRSSAVRAPSFRSCLAASVAIHLLLVLTAGHLPDISFENAPAVEVDLTSPLPGSGAAPKLGAPKRLIPRAPAVAPKPAEKPIPKEAVPVRPQPPKDWTLPSGQVKKEAPPPPPAAQITPGGAPGGTGTAAIPGGKGEGFNYGSPNGSLAGGSPLDVTKPVLLNADELRKNLRKFYPEDERRAGHEGAVTLYLHIDAAGAVSAADVKVSAGPSFDAAAQKVARLMKFKPATRDGQAIPVLIAVPIEFRLRD